MFDPVFVLAAEILAAAAAPAGESAGHGGASLFEDASFWVSLGLVVVVALFAYWGVHRKLGEMLDKRAQAIADELDRARALRDEAQEILAKYQRAQREAEDEAADIIEQARRDARQLAIEAREKIEAQLARRARAAEEKIARAEAQAIAEMRSQTADLAIEAAREIIRSRMDQGAKGALAERAIDELGSKLH